VDFTKVKVDPKACLVAKSDLGWLWHRRLAHVGMRNLVKLQKHEHILGLTMLFLRKIDYVVLVKPESMLEIIIPPRTFYPHQEH
jgi:hypothetical protein